METDQDPFASLAELCHISSSQKEHLRRCRFAGEQEEEDESLSDDEPGDIPLASTGIMMVSPPESLEDNENDDNLTRDNDIFHTPPEESTLANSQEQQQAVAFDNRDNRTVEGVANDEEVAAVDGNCTDDSRAVDLGRDTDIGFSAEVELTERIAIDSDSVSVSSPGVNRTHENEVIHRQSMNIGIMNRELTSNDCLCESLVKKSKIVDKNLGLVNLELCFGFEAQKTIDRVLKSTDKLKSWSKKSKILDENLVLETSRDTLGTETENLGKAVENSNFEGISPSNCLKSVQNLQIEEEVNVVDKEFHVESSAKRKLDFFTGALESNSEDNNAVLGFNEANIEGGSKEIEDNEANGLCKTSKRYSLANSPEKQNGRRAKSIDDIEKFRYVGPMGANSSKKQKNIRAQRALPLSLRGNNGNTGGKVAPDDIPCSRNYKQALLLNVLSMLTENYTYDPCLENLSVVEAAKRRGMTFP